MLSLVEWCSPSAYGHVRVLAEKEVYLFECAAIGLDSVEASHVNDCLGATSSSWSTLGTYLPEDCHMSLYTRENFISLAICLFLF